MLLVTPTIVSGQGTQLTETGGGAVGKTTVPEPDGRRGGLACQAEGPSVIMTGSITEVVDTDLPPPPTLTKDRLQMKGWGWDLQVGHLSTDEGEDYSDLDIKGKSHLHSCVCPFLVFII